MRRNPLHRARTDAELLGDLVQARPIRRSQCGADAPPSSLVSMKGRPQCLPAALARAMPAFTRSRIMERSNSANTPIIWNMAFASRRRGVDALLMQEQVDAQAVQLGEEAAEVLQ